MKNKNLVESINPYNQDLLKTYEKYSDTKVEEKINEADNVFKDQWSKTKLSHRASLFLNLKKLLDEDKEELSKLISLEMGKLKKEALAEIKKCSDLCEYYAKNASHFLEDKMIKTDYEKSYITYCPLGVILAVMPWNFPFWQVFRFAVPTLLAGNTALLKHASNVTGCALKIEELFIKAGFLRGVFNTLVIGSDQVEKIVKNSKVKAVSLTGSEQAGKAVAKTAGESLKKTLLELGGNDPYVILPDVDIKKTVATCLKGRLINSGQSCISPKRLIIHEKIYDDFKTELLKASKNLYFVDPLSEEDFDDESTIPLAPLNQLQARDELHETVKEAIKEGATCIRGGKIPTDTKGAFYPLTILEEIPKSSKAFDTEMFGPTLCLFKAKDLNECLAIANNSSFGLGAAIFSKDLNLAEKIAKNDLNSGSCFINDFVKSNQSLPFGGIKNSGFGRELSSFGIHEFTNIKTIAVRSN